MGTIAFCKCVAQNVANTCGRVAIFTSDISYRV